MPGRQLHRGTLRRVYVASNFGVLRARISLTWLERAEVLSCVGGDRQSRGCNGRGGGGLMVRQPRRNEWRCPFTRLISAGMLLTTGFAAILLPPFGATAKLSLNGDP